MWKSIKNWKLVARAMDTLANRAESTVEINKKLETRCVKIRCERESRVY